MQRRQYKHPPIDEAVCEIQFQDRELWDATLPGQLYELIKEDYPQKPRAQQQSLIAIDPAGLTIKPELSKYQFLSGESNRLVSLAPVSLSIHELKPYGGWEEFRKEIESVAGKFVGLVHGINVTRIGIRYINRISFESNNIEPRNFFTIMPEKAEGLPEMVSNFFVRIDFSYPGEQILARVSLANVTGQAPHPAVMLDIDAIWESSGNSLHLIGR